MPQTTGDENFSCIVAFGNFNFFFFTKVNNTLLSKYFFSLKKNIIFL